MLDVKQMIKSAEEALGWPYVSPGSNDKNGIDCSGLFVKIYRDQGQSIYHGSNRIYRDYCNEKGKLNISNISALQPGMAVFKWKDQQPKGYSDDLGDFSHIGLVVSADPLKIIHASSAVGCVTTDTKINKWSYWGKLKDVFYENQEPSESKDGEIMTATVYAENGLPVKMRAQPSSASSNFWNVPNGDIVEVIQKNDDWTHIKYLGKEGYMMTRFLKFEGEADEQQDQPSGDMILVHRRTLEDIYDMVGNILGLRG